MMPLHDTFIDALEDLLSAEKQLLKALPKMAAAATTPELEQAFTNHLGQTKSQVTRLERAFKSVQEEPKSKLCKAMQGLVAEGDEHIEEAGDELGDIGLIGAGQRVEHYEIAAYSSAIAIANALGYSEAVGLLSETLEEEEAAAELLTSICEPLLESTAAAEDQEVA